MDDGAGAPGRADGVTPAAWSRMPVKARCTPFSDPQHAGLQRGGRIAQGLDHLVGALVSLAPLADAAIARSPSGDRCTRSRRTSGVPDPRPRVALDSASPAAARPGTRRRAPATSGTAPARMSLGAVMRVHRVRGDAAPIALLPDDAEVPELEAADRRRRTRSSGVRSRCSSWPRCSLPSTSRMPAISRRTARLGPSFLRPRCRKATEITVLARTRAPGSRGRVASPRIMRKGVEHANRARMVVEQLAEVRFAQPSVDPRADLETHRRWDDRPTLKPPSRDTPVRSLLHRLAARCGSGDGFPDSRRPGLVPGTDRAARTLRHEASAWCGSLQSKDVGA